MLRLATIADTGRIIKLMVAHNTNKKINFVLKRSIKVLKFSFFPGFAHQDLKVFTASIGTKLQIAH